MAGRSISRKLTLTVLITSGGSLLLACLVFVVHDAVTLRRAMVRDANTLAQVIGINSAVALTFDDRTAATETLEALTAAHAVLRATIYDRNGELFARFTAAGVERGPAPILPAEIEDPRFHDGQLTVIREVSFKGIPVGTIAIDWNTRELNTRIERYAAIVFALFCLVTVAAAYNSSRLRRKIANPLSQLVVTSEGIAAGDLSARVEVSTDDEIGMLARTFNAMVMGLRGLVEEVRQSIGEVGYVSDSLRESGARMSADVQRQSKAVADTEESAEQVRASSLEVNANVEQLAAATRETSTSIHEMEVSIGEIANNMDNLNESIDTTSSAVDRVAGNIDEVARGVHTLREATDETGARIDELSSSVRMVEKNAVESHELSADTSHEASMGMKAVNETIAAMKEISLSFSQLENSVSHLAQRSQSIDEITQVISDVAEQTSLLSLNASIIAAQAGEHGKPFSVVADQVKSLANRTRGSTAEIAQLIRAIKDDSAAAVLAVDEGSAKVDQGVQRSNDAGAVLVKIIEKSQNSTARVREIADATTSQRGDLERVEGAIHDVRRIVETIHRSTRDQSRANTEIANAIQNIRELGEDVRRSTNEQRQGSSLITNSVNSVADQLRQIAGATQSQNKSCETIHDALRVFREVMDEATHRSDDINEMVSKLVERALQLESEIGRFKTS